MLRLKQNYTKAETTTVHQDLQKYKMLKQTPELNEQTLHERVVAEFGEEWGLHLGSVYEVLSFLQNEDESSKFLFNSVKNVTKALPKDGEKLKISNGFKNMVAKIVRQTLVALAYKLEVYLEHSHNHQIKLEDIRMIV